MILFGAAGRYPLRVAADERITWEHGERRGGPNETIGVLELRIMDS